jgi:PAS domain S-box-containing protein
MHDNVLSGNSEMAKRMREVDWARTAVGPVSDWPDSLKTAVSICLGSRYPIVIWWGRESMTQFYNDAYIPVLGRTKHPGWLGRSGLECWKDLLPVIEPMWRSVYDTGEATWSEDLVLHMDRNVPQEETYFTFSYSAMRDGSGAVAGIFCACNETTGRVVGERRLRTLRDLGDKTRGAGTAEEACRAAITALAKNPDDVPFASIYLANEDLGAARLVASCGIEVGGIVVPETVGLLATEKPALWPLARLHQTATAELVPDLRDRFGDALRMEAGRMTPDGAMAMPIATPGQLRPAGFLIAGLNPRRVWDADYRGFLDLAVGHVASGIADARAYEAERRRAEALAELDRAKTAFFSNVSHEFRTPLTLMLGPLEATLTGAHGELPDEVSATLSVAQRNGRRLLKLVNTLLDFSRIEAGRVEASYERTDLSLLTADIASGFRSAIEGGGLQLVMDCPELPEPIYVDRDMWEKIVLNLLSNAFKFTFDGSITVTLRPAGDSVELAVADTGVGISAEELPRIFERFHRVKNARSRTHEGTGIGLALVQELAKLHGGSVAVQSAAGAGSTFTVSIPTGMAHLPADRLAAAKTLASTAVGASPFLEEAVRWSPGTGRPAEIESDLMIDGFGHDRTKGVTEDGPRVLLADDNADMREYVRSLLGRRYRFSSVGDGRSALESIRQSPPDLLLTDVMMPGLDGFELLAALRADERTRTLPVILISARAGEESRIEGLAAGADDYLVKPFTARELRALVESQLHLARVRRDTEDALRIRAEQFETLLQRAPLGVYLIDADFRVREANPIACAAIGLEAADLIGRRLDDVIRPACDEATIAEFVGNLRHVMQSGESLTMAEQEVVRIDRGANEYYEWRIDRISLPDGDVGLVCYFMDISQQVLARKGIEESRAALQDADRRKDDFLATLAHELRNPLAPIASGLHALQLLENDAATTSRLHKMLNRQVEHMVRLVDDLMEVARITRGKIEIEKRRVDLATIIEGAVEVAKPYIGTRKHQLVVDIGDEPLHLDADLVRVEQTLANLLNNAARYTEEGGTIRLRARRDGSDAVVIVQDNGIGISAEMLPKVFEPFTQVQTGRSRGHGGLGVGLTLARTLVELHGGTLEARSEGIGKGSEFTVRLPLAAELHGDTRSPVAQEPRPGSHRVLVVDDHRDAAEAMAAMLQIIGMDVRVAHDGATALDMMETFQPSVVLLDIGMPGMDGYEVARRARLQPFGSVASLVALTGWGQDEDFERSKAAGMDAHLVKPADRARLEALLARMPPPATATTAGAFD